jgi:hypothetical protein
MVNKIIITEQKIVQKVHIARGTLDRDVFFFDETGGCVDAKCDHSSKC